jgi:hypothetical protein
MDRVVSERQRGVIKLRVPKTDHLFHAFDPAPMVGRDLDDEVESYIIESAQELPQRHYRLVIHIGEPEDQKELGEVASAVRSYFAYRGEVQARRLRLMLREGRHALAIGFGFLLLCWTVGFLAVRFLPSPLGEFLNEGLLIFGWVANWRPAEIFLYDRRAMKRQKETLDALSVIDVQFRLDQQEAQG